MWHDAVLVAGKDLRIEARSRVGAVAGGALRRPRPGAAGLRHRARRRRRCATPRRASSGSPCSSRPCWPFSAAWPSSRARAPATACGSRASTRPGSSSGKAAAVGLQLLVLQIVLWAGVTFLFDVRVHVVWLAVTASLLATVGLACAGRALRRAVGRPARARHAAAAARAARAGPGAAGRVQGVAGRARRQRDRRAPSGCASSSRSP